MVLIKSHHVQLYGIKGGEKEPIFIAKRRCRCCVVSLLWCREPRGIPAASQPWVPKAAIFKCSPQMYQNLLDSSRISTSSSHNHTVVTAPAFSGPLLCGHSASARSLCRVPVTRNQGGELPVSTHFSSASFLALLLSALPSLPSG